MAAPPLNLYVDIQRRILVKSAVSTTQSAVLILRQGETPSLRIYFCDPDGGTVSVPYPQFYKPADLAVKVGICAGDPTGGTDTLVAYQDTFTLSGNYFGGTLNCNTEEMASALAAIASKAGRLEVEITPSGESPIKLCSEIILLQAAVIDDAGVIPTPRSEYPTRDEVTAGFVRKVGEAGDTILLVGDDGSAVELRCVAGQLDALAIPVYP